MHNFLPFAYLKNKFIPFEQANISIATHALHYGTAAFGGLRAIPDPKNGEVLLFRLADHAKRLSQSATLLQYQIEPEKIAELIVEFVKQNQISKPSYIRPLIYASDLGISPRLHNLEKDLLIYGLELGDYLSAEGVSCCFSSWVRQEDRMIPGRGKIAGSYITSSLAKTEAIERGFDEALMFNSQGKISEASGMNVFMVKNGVLITPGSDQDILEGITRRSVIQLAQSEGIEVKERPIDKSELLIAEEVFLSGTAAKITPVSKIEMYTLPPARPITDKLRQLFNQITTGQTDSYSNWLTRI
ncbi:MAG: branched-chain amino acid transaminase [Patescibacteria group bacterium]